MLEKILGNFMRVAQNDGKFPVVAGTLEKLQNNTELIAYLGNVLGQKYVILAGCVQTGNRRSEGYVYVRNSDNEPGDILYYPGASAVSPYCYVKSVDENIVAAGEPFKSAYTKKSLSDGLPSGGETKILWSDFVVGSEIFAEKKKIQAELDKIHSDIAYVNNVGETLVVEKNTEFSGGGLHKFCDFPALSSTRWAVAVLKIREKENINGAADPVVYIGDCALQGESFNNKTWPFASQLIIPPGEKVSVSMYVNYGGYGFYSGLVRAELQYRLI